MKNKWICTDPDNQQYGRRISKTVFEFKERGQQLIINLDSYNYSGKWNYCSAYYSKEDFEKLANWIIAECIFEQESGLY